MLLTITTEPKKKRTMVSVLEITHSPDTVWAFDHQIDNTSFTTQKTWQTIYYPIVLLFVLPSTRHVICMFVCLSTKTCLKFLSGYYRVLLFICLVAVVVFTNVLSAFFISIPVLAMFVSRYY
uniref:Uncharacterized protein n=1 Tax=Cacopsylla melanoneura TaxID=428564 RepID=A0A8D8ZLM4_9HEMI